MKLIRTIREEDFGRVSTPEKWASYRVRPAARAVLLDEASRIALMFVAKYGYYKLPGGGVDEGEDLHEALKREVREEVGVTDLEIVSELGVIHTYCDQIEAKAENYGFVARKKGEIVEPARTEHELVDGFQTVWVDDIDQAIKLMEASQQVIDDYGQGFIVERELTFLKQAKANYFN